MHFLTKEDNNGKRYAGRHLQCRRDCRQREANARAESAERVEQTKADAKQVVLSAKEKAQKDADMLFEKTAKESKKELEKASEKANLECDILSRTADKNRKRVIDGAIQRLSL